MVGRRRVRAKLQSAHPPVHRIALLLLTSLRLLLHSGKSAQLAIFPAQPAEVTEHLDAMLAAAHKQESEAQDKLDAASAQVAKVLGILGQMNGGLLTAPQTSTEPLPVEQPDAD